MKLKTKLSIFTIAIIVFIIFAISFSIFLYIRKTYIENAGEEQRSIFKNLVHFSKEALIVRDELLLLNNIRSLKKTYSGIKYINFISASGERTLLTDRNAAFRAHLVIDVEEEISKSYNDKKGANIFEISAPLYIGDERIGVNQIGFSQRYYDERISETIGKAGKRILVVSLISLLTGLIFALLLSEKITDPIKKLASGARSIGEGKLSVRIKVKSHDELGMLAGEFNKMAVKLAELDKAKDDFVNAVSHELRTPLAAIEGYIDLLIEGGDSLPLEKKNRALTIMKMSSERLSKFISDILDIAKIKASKMYFEKKPNNLQNIIIKVVGLLAFMAQKKEIKMDIEVEEDLPEVMVDGDKINQVFTNLIGNALKFTPGGGKITVGAKIKDSNILAFVSDTGPGIPADDLKRIFKQFEQSESAKNISGPKGTGLGLSIAEGIVQLHSGKIWVESEIGSGTTFYFTIPI